MHSCSVRTLNFLQAPKSAKAASTKKPATSAKDDNENEDPTAIFENIDNKKSGNKRDSIERIYQKKTQLEHILLRPDTYVGSVERTEPKVT